MEASIDEHLPGVKSDTIKVCLLENIQGSADGFRNN